MGLLLSPLILQHFGWRALFYIFGLVGAPLLLLWAALVPSQAGKVAGGAAAGGSGSGGGSRVGVPQLLSRPATWAIIIVNFGAPCQEARLIECRQRSSCACAVPRPAQLAHPPALLVPYTLTCPFPTPLAAVNHWGYFIYLNWMPTYFYKELGGCGRFAGRGALPLVGGAGPARRAARAPPACPVVLATCCLPQPGCPTALCILNDCRHGPESQLSHELCTLGGDGAGQHHGWPAGRRTGALFQLAGCSAAPARRALRRQAVPAQQVAFGDIAKGVQQPPAPHPPVPPQVRRGVPVLTVRRGIQTAAFLGPVAALMALANPAISPPLALLSMTAALGITSLGAGSCLLARSPAWVAAAPLLPCCCCCLVPGAATPLLLPCCCHAATMLLPLLFLPTFPFCRPTARLLQARPGLWPT